MAGFEDAYKKYTESGQGAAIAGMHDAQTQASLNGLKAAYDQNIASQQAAREQIGTTYQNSANNMQAQYERNRRNLNQQAAANGINTGAGSQQQLALQNVWNRDYGALQGQQAQAYANADLAIANLTTNYQNAIQQAQAQGDYRKMAALLDGYNADRERQMQEAKLLAGFGNFSGYEGIYSPDQINSMRQGWIAQNPLAAYNTGAITADQYYRMTGQYAPGHAPATTARSGGGSRTTTTDPFAEKAGDTTTKLTGNALSDVSRAAYAIGTARPDEAKAEANRFLASHPNLTEAEQAQIVDAYEHATHTGYYAPGQAAARNAAKSVR